MSERLPAGLFRARATETGTVLSATPSAMRLLGAAIGKAEGPFTLAGLFGDDDVYLEFLGQLTRDGQAERMVHVTTTAPGTQTISVRAIHTPAQGATSAVIEGIIEEITDDARQAAECEMLRNAWRHRCCFLHDPSRAEPQPVFCPDDDDGRQAAEADEPREHDGAPGEAPGAR